MTPDWSMRISDYPLVTLVAAFVLMTLAAWIGGVIAARRGPMTSDARDDFNVVQAATLTLLGLIIGFTFSMALNRYDQRKNYEEEEANAIGTAYLRADLLDAAAATRMRTLLMLEKESLSFSPTNWVSTRISRGCIFSPPGEPSSPRNSGGGAPAVPSTGGFGFLLLSSACFLRRSSLSAMAVL